MFTGIIDKKGQVLHVEKVQDSGRLLVRTGYEDLQLGESVAVNGVCLTVAETFGAEGNAHFFVSPETLARSNLGSLTAGAVVNTERALLPTTRLSGHLVQGHVDAVATVVSIDAQDESYVVRFRVPGECAIYCVEKGSVALNGVSLTLNAVKGDEITVALIPHTWKHTNISLLQPGDVVNLEVDILAKYVRQLCQPYR